MDRIVENIVSKYSQQNIDFRDVACTWKEAGFTVKDVQDTLISDLSETLDMVDSKKVFRFASELASNEEYINYLGGNDHELDALVNKKLAKLTPNIKSRLISNGNNTFTVKEAKEQNVSWRLVSKKESDGQDVIYLARVTNTTEEELLQKVAAEMPMVDKSPSGNDSEVLIAKVELKGDAVNLTPTNCPGKGKAQDIPTDESGKQTCILSGKKCPHLKTFSLEPLSGDKTIICDIAKG